MCSTWEWHASQNKHKPETEIENIRERWDNTFWRNFSKRAVTRLLEKMMNTDQFLSIPLLKGNCETAMHIYINGDNWLLWILSTIRSKTKIISSRRVAYCRHCSTSFPPERNSAAPGQQHHEPRCWPLRQHTIFSPPIPVSLPGLCELLKIPETKWEYWEPVAACKYALVWRDGGSVH